MPTPSHPIRDLIEDSRLSLKPDVNAFSARLAIAIDSPIF